MTYRRTLPELVHWYARRWWEEFPSLSQGVNPETMHVDRPKADSSLGAHHRAVNTDLPPQVWEYITDSPYAEDMDGYYKWPLHAALASLAHKSPFMEHYLRLLPAAGYDWYALALAMGIRSEVAGVYAEAALNRLHGRYVAGPMVGPSR